MSRRYDYEESMNTLKELFHKLGRIPNKNDFQDSNIKPNITWYTDRLGGMDNACYELGLIDKPLTKEERVEYSITEMKELCAILERYPTQKEYTDYIRKGYSIYPLKEHSGIVFSKFCMKYAPEYQPIVLDGIKICTVCDEAKPFEEFQKGERGIGGCRHFCKLCDFFDRNKDLKVQKGWTMEEYEIVIDSLLNEKIKTVDELVGILSGKTVDDIINLLHYHLIIGGRTKIRVSLPCEECGESVVKTIGIYIKSKNIFCSTGCYWKHKKENTPIGVDNPDWSRIDTECSDCGEKISVIPYDYNKKNSFGDKHNFCSQECYWEFRKKYYHGKKGGRYGYKCSKEEIKQMRIRTVKLYSDGVFDRQTKPQKITNNILKEMGINCENEYNCKYYSMDNYLIDYNLMIEVHGDYFHASPLKYDFINEMQYKNIIGDKRKSTYIKRYYMTPILYLWEYDLLHNKNMCKMLISRYVEHDGLLEEYNSFNYSVENDILVVNETIIKPYAKYTPRELDMIRVNEDSKWVTFNCDSCDKEVHRHLSQYKLAKNHFCSQECSIDFRRVKNKSKVI